MNENTQWSQTSVADIHAAIRGTQTLIMFNSVTPKGRILVADKEVEYARVILLNPTLEKRIRQYLFDNHHPAHLKVRWPELPRKFWPRKKLQLLRIIWKIRFN